MSEDKFTVCTKCKFLINGKVWYDRYCIATQKEKVRDPYDGKWKYGEVNDLGTVYITDERYPNARNVNKDGNCVFYEEK